MVVLAVSVLVMEYFAAIWRLFPAVNPVVMMQVYVAVLPCTFVSRRVDPEVSV